MIAYYNKILTIEAGWLIENGVFSKSNYYQLSNRRQIKVVRRACYTKPALVAYDSMPDRFKCKVVAILGESPYKYEQKNLFTERIEESIEAMVFFEDYKLADGRKLPIKTRHTYYVNAILFDAIIKLVKKRKALRPIYLEDKKINKWEQISTWLQELPKSKYPHTLPTNIRRLQNRCKEYEKQGCISLIHKNFLNSNAKK